MNAGIKPMGRTPSSAATPHYAKDVADEHKSASIGMGRLAGPPGVFQADVSGKDRDELLQLRAQGAASFSDRREDLDTVLRKAVAPKQRHEDFADVGGPVLHDLSPDAISSQLREVDGIVPLPRDALDPLARASYPFDQVRALRLPLHASCHERVRNQLVFFAAIEGPAQNFSLRITNGAHRASYVADYRPDASGLGMKSFIREALPARILGSMSLGLDDWRTKMQICASPDRDPVASLFAMHALFREALRRAYERGVAQGDHQRLVTLLESVNCLDAGVSDVSISQCRLHCEQDAALTSTHQPPLPYLLGEGVSVRVQTLEFMHLFRFFKAHDFERLTGEPATEWNGNLRERFAAEYLHTSGFEHFLRTHRAASELSEKQRAHFCENALEMGLLTEQSCLEQVD